MSDDYPMVIEGPECCILEICCGGREQVEALAGKLVTADGLNERQAMVAAEWILARYDLAPKGSLEQLKRTVAKLARTYPGRPGYE